MTNSNSISHKLALLDPPAENKGLFDGTVRFGESLGAAAVADGHRASFSRERWKRCADQGLLAIAMPTEWGGTPGDAVTLAITYEALGYGCSDNGLVFSLLSQLLSCQLPLALHGNRTLQERYLPGLIRGDLIAAHAATEAGAGSDTTAVLTRARKVDGGFVLNGTKTFATLGPESDLALVLARMEGEASGFIELVVPRSAYEVSRDRGKIGLDTAPVGELTFEDSFVPSESVLSAPGSGLMSFLTIMEWERLLIMAGSLGAMRRELERTIAHAQGRTQFGRTIGQFQAVAHRIVDMASRLHSARLVLYDAAAKKAAGRRVTAEASLAKLCVSEARIANAIDAIRIFGGAGCLTEVGVERELRDGVPGVIYSGTSDIQRNTIARLLGLPTTG